MEQKRVTEVFVTHVKPKNYQLYSNWASKIQKLEAKFPGYVGAYLQAPSVNDPQAFVTVLQFDTPENLNLWLNSQERADILKESEMFIENFEPLNLKNPFFAWFPSTTPKKIITIIKETMLVLLILFPIVMLQIKFLNPHLTSLHLSPATFIGNVISVSLISFPMMPICLYCLGWWLRTDFQEGQFLKNVAGFLLVFFLYLLEVLIFMV